MFALLSRPSVGLGPVLALSLLLTARVVQRVVTWWRSRQSQRRGRIGLAAWLGLTASQARGRVWPVALAVAIPLVAYVYVNEAKLGNLFGVPYEKQDLQLARPERRAALEATGNSLLSLDYLPSNIVAYFRPDGIGFRPTFPWITFADTPEVFGRVHFDNIEPLASVTVTSIALLILTAFGAVAATRGVSRRSTAHEPTAYGMAARDEASWREGTTAAVFRVPLLAAAGASLATVAIGDLFERYEGDFIPVLVLGGALGLGWLGVLVARRRWVRRVTVAALIALAAWSCWTTFGLTLIYQREYSGLQTPALRAGFVGFQLDLNDALGLSLPRVRRGATLPVRPSKFEVLRTTAHHGELFVVGDCEGLFISSGRSWEPVEHRSRGEEKWTVRFGPPRPGVRFPLWSAGTGPLHVIWAHWMDARHVRIEYQWTAYAGFATGGTMRVEPGREYHFHVVLDRRGGGLDISREGTIPGRPGTRLLLWKFAAPFATARGPHLGRQPDPAVGATEFDGTIRRSTVTPLCDRLTR